jgi:hypothetical protein
MAGITDDVTDVVNGGYDKASAALFRGMKS